MNYLANANADLADFQTTLAQYQATIAPPGTFSDATVFLLIAAGAGILLILSLKS
jgi:hypothetical protein